VALARALVLEPSLLLLDEPLSALDLGTREAIRGELREIVARLPCATVYVTHSPLEAMVFGRSIAVIEGGQVTQVGTREELLTHPRTPYVATLLGVNLFQGSIVERDQAGVASVRTADGTLVVADPGGNGAVFMAVSPREITLSLEPPAGSAQNVLHGPIRELVPEPPAGERVRVALRTTPPLVAEVTRHAVEALGLEEGLAVYASFKATGVTTYR
jgi:molybdate transport system ATP-binding protein